MKPELPRVQLKFYSPIKLISDGIRESHNSFHLSDTNEKIEKCLEKLIEDDCPDSFSSCQNLIGDKDFNLIKRVGVKMKHESVLEHSFIVYRITASRALLQELSRHRIGVSPTVKSTRYTLKELKTEESFLPISEESIKRASKYVYLTRDNFVNESIIKGLEELRLHILNNISNDVAKYCLPEAFLFTGQYSLNLRSLTHLLSLRIHKDALFEFRMLSKRLIDPLPDEYKEIIFENEYIRKNYDIITEELNNIYG